MNARHIRTGQGDIDTPITVAPKNLGHHLLLVRTWALAPGTRMVGMHGDSTPLRKAVWQFLIKIWLI